MRMNQSWQPLNDDEARVIVRKGTERPFTGEYTQHSEAGVYTCRRCGAALYRSDSKFDAGCGWPSFDDAVPGAVKRQPDADGRRTEILCAACEGHLGHVFTGEHFTPRDTRHCVNSISMRFVAEAALPQHFRRAVFAGGCFWGVEYYLQQAPGVIRATNGYTGGHVANPTYAQVCDGNTGHIEAVEVLYDPRQTDYEKLARLFFEIHDPTQTDRQGPDVGMQYRSVIYYGSPEEQASAVKLIGLLKAKGVAVATRVEPIQRFWPAEPVHQDYYFKKGQTPYCHRPVSRFK
ncbi:MAG: bifunctional methionine sulfoxide reductase B/A protein [Kiritimatiellae bacterium]|nr:bifunctional methionine sulfoxide reductase B/A protein [Kiritimatiellia bacterium]